MLHILVLSISNATAGQMAHGFMDYFTNERAQIYSAGLEPQSIHTNVIDSMDVVGIDVSDYSSNHINDYQKISFDYIITIGDDIASRIPKTIAEKASIIDFPIANISELNDGNEDTFAKARKKIQAYCEEFIESELKKIEKTKAIKKVKKRLNKKKKKQD
ncbi:arsenate reductase/protein-tyrosine-phosphatase family protein [Nonlabens ulvanivorans]|uniref:arsenate reductase/protein-tyrosine-phosphatase family protein n=1 Tax=Nonlabens ulvanivorans TaxID=906888 RepID=UPI0029428120|nr:hypothetical protein [Nonlabens ulvanivorans]WOI22650.1 hypothetical protein R1T42_13380 [Nonlabens ulvanivorans]